MKEPLKCEQIMYGAPSDLVLRVYPTFVPPSNIADARNLAVGMGQKGEPTWILPSPVEGIRVVDANGIVMYRYTRDDFESDLSAWMRDPGARP
jgi:hypothetical protein